MDYEKEHQAFKDLLMALSAFGSSNKAKRSTGAPILPVIADRKLSDALSARVGRLDGVIALAPPPNNDFADWSVYMWADWRFTEEAKRAKLEIGFIKNARQAYYFRFEHSGPQNERHRYWHSQFTRRFTNFQNAPESDWKVHTSYPAFPIACGDSVGLVVASAISVYGATLDSALKSRVRSIGLSDAYLRGVLELEAA